MNDPAAQYLWGGSGPVDPVAAALESALRPARYRSRPLALPPEEDLPPASVRPHRPAVRGSRERRGVAAAAAILMAALAAVLARPGDRAGGSWFVEALEGRPRVESRAIAGSARLDKGAWLETDPASTARLTVPRLGLVTVEPGSRVRLKDASPGRSMLELPVGSIHASIIAPPGVFLVDTPSALAIDLGCEYTLRVAESGASHLEVITGIVRLEGRGRFANVPHGHTCDTRPETGPGLPLALDAPRAVRDGAEAYEHGKSNAVEYTLEHARRADGVTLWHLLHRTEGEQRARIFERLAALHPLPRGVTRSGALSLDETELDLWWDRLLYGD